MKLVSLSYKILCLALSLLHMCISKIEKQSKCAVNNI